MGYVLLSSRLPRSTRRESGAPPPVSAVMPGPGIAAMGLGAAALAVADYGYVLETGDLALEVKHPPPRLARDLEFF